MRLAILLILMLAIPDLSLLAAPNTFRVVPSGTRIEFTVPVRFQRDVRGTSKELAGEFIYDTENGQLSLPIPVGLPIKEIKTGLHLRDRVMYRMFDAERFPLITATVTGIDCDESARKGNGNCTVNAVFKIRDIEKTLSFPVKLVAQTDLVNIEGSFVLSTDDFQLKRPSLFGIFRAGKKVRVRMTSLWKVQGIS